MRSFDRMELKHRGHREGAEKPIPSRMPRSSAIPNLNHMTFRMPAEWEPHEATWLGWPHELTDWPGKFAPIPWEFAEIVRHLANVERVNLLVEDRAAEARVRGILRKSHVNLDAVTFFHVPTDRGWMRDSGPIAVCGDDGASALLNFAFNGWAKYDDYKKDAKVVGRLAEQMNGMSRAKVDRRAQHAVPLR